MKKIVHGGDLDAIEKIYKIPRNEIIDFSGNINPLGLSDTVKNELIKNINIIETYPDKDYINLKNSILNYINLDLSVENILVGNGSTELISSFIKTIKPQNSLVIEPTYSEYKREIANNKGNFSTFLLKKEDNFKLNLTDLINSLKNIDLLVICNPNNPTGSVIKPDKLKEILDFCQKNNIFVMIDETYIEFTKTSQNVSAIQFIKDCPNLFVIRGTSKFFCVSGLRLGYALCSNQNILRKINQKKDPWSVNSFANLAGIVMFNDKKFIRNTLDLIEAEKCKIYNFLDNIKSLKYYKSYSNFILTEILDKDIKSQKLFEILIKNKILIRNASSFDGLNEKFFRFCILKQKENELLLQNLKDIFC